MKDPFNKEKTAYEILNVNPHNDVKIIREKYLDLRTKHPEKAFILYEAFRMLKMPEERIKIDFFYYYLYGRKK